MTKHSLDLGDISRCREAEAKAGSLDADNRASMHHRTVVWSIRQATRILREATEEAMKQEPAPASKEDIEREIEQAVGPDLDMETSDSLDTLDGLEAFVRDPRHARIVSFAAFHTHLNRIRAFHCPGTAWFLEDLQKMLLNKPWGESIGMAATNMSELDGGYCGAVALDHPAFNARTTLVALTFVYLERLKKIPGNISDLKDWKPSDELVKLRNKILLGINTSVYKPLVKVLFDNSFAAETWFPDAPIAPESATIRNTRDPVPDLETIMATLDGNADQILAGLKAVGLDPLRVGIDASKDKVLPGQPVADAGPSNPSETAGARQPDNTNPPSADQILAQDDQDDQDSDSESSDLFVSARGSDVGSETELGTNEDSNKAEAQKAKKAGDSKRKKKSKKKAKKQRQSAEPQESQDAAEEAGKDTGKNTDTNPEARGTSKDGSHVDEPANNHPEPQNCPELESKTECIASNKPGPKVDGKLDSNADEEHDLKDDNDDKVDTEHDHKAENDQELKDDNKTDPEIVTKSKPIVDNKPESKANDNVKPAVDEPGVDEPDPEDEPEVTATHYPEHESTPSEYDNKTLRKAKAQRRRERRQAEREAQAEKDRLLKETREKNRRREEERKKQELDKRATENQQLWDEQRRLGQDANRAPDAASQEDRPAPKQAQDAEWINESEIRRAKEAEARHVHEEARKAKETDARRVK